MLDRAIAALAAKQHGVLARRQLLALGATRHEVQWRLDTGRLHRLRRGVYAVGHTVISQHGRWTAAVLAAGPGAVLSRRSAAALWGIRRWTGVAEVTVPTKRPQRPGLRLCCAVLADDEREVHHGIPVTTVARTILDLAAVLPPQYVERAFHEAEYLQLTSPTSLAALLARHRGRPGARALPTLLARAATQQRTRTDMEADFLAFCDEHRLPRPLTDVPLGDGTIPDAVYVEGRILIELDGGSHTTEQRFNDDRRRDRSHLVDRWRTVRVTARDLTTRGERRALAADLRALLAAPEVR